ncbi:MAG: hydrolase [Bacteroidetes bacterium]|nr:MAG: hydrolase [Bacteroidota bacterium]
MTRTIISKGAKIRISDTGKGRAVVLLHGFLESMEIWDDFAAQLSKRYRVICIDLPGHGRSECVGYVHRMEKMAEVVKDVMDELGLRKYVIVGHSMGGYVALAFAELFPDHLRGLCLFHSTAWADSDQKKLDRERAIRMVKRNPLPYTRQLVTNLFAAANVMKYKKEIDRLKKIAARTSKQGIVAALEGMKVRSNREAILRFAGFPVQIMAGKRDNVLPWETLKSQAALAASGRFKAWDNVGHMGFVEARNESLRLLKRFCFHCFRQKVREA